MKTYIEIQGAKENNLKNIHVQLPHYALTVVTGISGSGKSSLAHDTLFKEGQRRFLESLSPYARQFLGQMEKPDVDRIEGLAPALCIDQKRHGFSFRSTVGTITEIYDHLRLLFARLGTPYCPHCHIPVIQQNSDQITSIILQNYSGKAALILAPMILERKGEYRKDLAQWLADGFMRVRIDGQVHRLDESITLGRYEKHTLELVIDRLTLEPQIRGRLSQDIENAVALTQGTVAIAIEPSPYQIFSVHRACPQCGFSIPELEPRLFSFNNDQGACPECHGHGVLEQFDPKLVVAHPELTIKQGAIAAMKKDDGKIIFSSYGLDEIEALAKSAKVDLATPWEKLPESFQNLVLWGMEQLPKNLSQLNMDEENQNPEGKKGFCGVIPELQRIYFRWHLPQCRKFIQILDCQTCHGQRLRIESLNVLFKGKSITDLTSCTIQELSQFLDQITLDDREQAIAREILRELKRRLRFLLNVGLPYLTVDRHADTLAGGELQRIRLARQLGSGLEGVLYILDEPSIGLHPRDNAQLIQALIKLRDSGNTVIVIEHDEETMRAADYILDIGPGAGIHGGDIVAQGQFEEIQHNPSSITGQYLIGNQEIPIPKTCRQPQEQWLVVRGAQAHNLKNIDVEFPVGLFIAVTGVSGSGKSTLVSDILCPALSRELNENSEIPGKHKCVEGMQYFKKIIEVDQSPIGRTPRSNPVTYIKLWEQIRDLFAMLPESKTRGYGPARFSFNLKGGRCELCMGAGYEEIEMEFLSNVLIPCEECNGRRFNRETLEITYKGKNIYEILEMTVLEACEFFSNHPKILRPLQILSEVGLDYIKLGQPAPTLSGGEAQRIKLVRELSRNSHGKTLYILDEPTTGLHFADIQKLLYALQKLVDQKNTVVIIEHNLDVVKTVDWIIDLGPEAGEQGGQVVVAGPPETVMQCQASHTGNALRAYLQHQWNKYPCGKIREMQTQEIRIQSASKHNLKNISLNIPKNKLVVVTGLSGSGKSSLVFDTLFAEGQRRFLESLSTYARRFLGRMEHGSVENIEGLAPSIAIDQKSISKNPRSTVATMTEIYDYLRVLYARVGIPHCPQCHAPLIAYTPTSAANKLLQACQNQEGMILAPLYLPGTKKQFSLISAGQLGEYAKHLQEAGFTRVLIAGKVRNLDDLGHDLGKRLPIHLVIDRVKVTSENLTRMAESLETAFNWGHKVALFFSPSHKNPVYFCELPGCVPCDYYQTQELQPRHFSFNHYLGACPSCNGLGVQEDEITICPECQGQRLKPEYLAVTIDEKSISQCCNMSISNIFDWIEQLHWSKNQATVVRDVLREIKNRLRFLQEVGLEYLTLDRPGNSLSGGEAQRIRLATQIGNQLVGVLYVLDEPTIGLHQRDTERLLTTLRELVDLGNTVIMVEHDPQCIQAADHVIELGPGAGVYGGHIVAQGTVANLKTNSQSLTGQYLAGKLPLPKTAPFVPTQAYLTIHGARLHNLKNITAKFPAQRFNVVTGVSGSGKSSLVVDILQRAVLEFQRIRSKTRDKKEQVIGSRSFGFDKITGLEQFDRFVIIDQSPIMKTPSSNPATYCDVFTPIRQLFATLPGSKARGFGASRFSFNITGGRCEVCEGRGLLHVEMHFLSDVWVTCHACQGKRFLDETLAVHYRDKNIAQVLDMDIAEALTFFDAQPRIKKKLQILYDIGLGYMRLGQPVNTLSGGESQRLKLASELCQGESGRTLYIMDEPTTGLHAVDIQKLLQVIRALLKNGHTVIVIEHNLDIIRASDWVIDLGPEAADQGGQILYMGPTSGLPDAPTSITGKMLKN